MLSTWNSAQHSEAYNSWLFTTLAHWHHHGTFAVGLNMDWMFLSPQNSYIEILTSNVMVLGGGAFERGGRESGVLINELVPL